MPIGSNDFSDINKLRGYWKGFSHDYNKGADDTKVIDAITKTDTLTEESAKYSAIVGVGRMQIVSQADGVVQDTLYEGYDSTKVPNIFSNGLTIYRLARDNAQAPYSPFDKWAKMFVKSKNDTLNYHCASALNTAHADTAPDGEYIFDTDHPLEDGSGTFSNKTSGELSYSVLQDALIAFQYVKNGRGMYMNQKPGVLLVPPALELEAKNILGAAAPGTSDNDMNVIKDFNLKLVVFPYLTSSKISFLFEKDKESDAYPFRFIKHTDYETNAWVDNDIVGGALKLSAYMVSAFHFPYVRGMHSMYAV